MKGKKLSQIVEAFKLGLETNPLDQFLACGEEVDASQWEEIDCREADEIPLTVDHIYQHLSKQVRLASRIPGDSRKSSDQDTSLFKVRYKYAGNPSPEREFCRKVMSANRVYRAEDIQLAGNLAVNPGFGPNGANTYSVWKYHGGVNCKHFWQRVIYLKKNNKHIGVNEARRIINELDPKDRPDAKWKQNEPEVAQIASPSNNYWRLMTTKQRISMALSQAWTRSKLRGGVTIESRGIPPEVGSPVFILQDDGSRERMPEGKHELEDGRVMVIDANGLYKELRKKTEMEKQLERFQFGKKERFDPNPYQRTVPDTALAEGVKAALAHRRNTQNQEGSSKDRISQAIKKQMQ